MAEKGKFVLADVILLFAVFFVLVLSSCKRNNSDQQKQVVLYCSVDQSVAEPIIAEFEKLSGIKVLARYDTEASKTVGLVQRIRAEAAKPIADVFWSSEVFHTIRLADEGLLSEYQSSQTQDWPGRLADSEGRWYGFGLRVRVIAYNSEKISGNEAPKFLEDVLESRWRGRIVMARPEFGTTGGDVASWFAHYGPERATEILRMLKANRIRLVNGNSTAVRMVATGRADICFTDTDDVYAAQRNGWPIAMNYLDQGGAGALSIPNTAAVIKGKADREEVRVLMEFLLSERLEEMLVRSDSHNSPIHLSLAEKFKEYALVKPLEVDYERVAEQLPTAIRIAREILR